MRLRDLPGLAESAEKLYEQLKGYVGRLPGSKPQDTPYTTAKKKRKRLKWE